MPVAVVGPSGLDSEELVRIRERPITVHESDRIDSVS